MVRGGSRARHPHWAHRIVTLSREGAPPGRTGCKIHTFRRGGERGYPHHGVLRGGERDARCPISRRRLARPGTVDQSTDAHHVDRKRRDSGTRPCDPSDSRRLLVARHRSRPLSFRRAALHRVDVCRVSILSGWCDSVALRRPRRQPVDRIRSPRRRPPGTRAAPDLRSGGGRACGRHPVHRRRRRGRDLGGRSVRVQQVRTRNVAGDWPQ